MKAHRLVVTTAAVASVAALIGAGAAAANGTPDWRDALDARSAALNEKYGLGKYARQTARAASTPDWLAALNARSDALNQHYGLGDYAAKR